MTNLLITNARAITLDPTTPRAEAVLVQNERITAVGANHVVAALAPEGTPHIDARNRALIPGFVETHTHPLSSGVARLTTVNCGTPPNRTIEDVLARLSDAVRSAEGTTPVRGTVYDDSLIEDNRHLTRNDLDRVSTETPIVVTHVSGHLAYANSAAFTAAGIDESTEDPEGGHLDRASSSDDAGRLTGVLYETALRLIAGVAVRPDREQQVEAAIYAGAELAKVGVTSVHDVSGGASLQNSLDIYGEAIRRDAFAPRMRVALPYAALAARHGALEAVPHVQEAGWRSGFGNDRLQVGMMKITQDGSLQGYSGALTEGYHDRPDETGMLLIPQPTFDTVVAQALAAGIQVGTHANGDRAIDSTLDAYERALEQHPVEDHRLRIEHCQSVRDDQLDRIARLGVHVSFFNLHVHYWGTRHRDRFLGPDRGSRISPLRSAQQRGITFVGHSDWWVTPVDPLFNVHVAVNRNTREGDTLGPDERIDAVSALRMMTIDGARLAFEENDKGTITPGKLGDLVLLSDDPLAVPPEAIDTIEIDTTIVGGTIAYDRATDAGSHRDERLARDPSRDEAYT
ncbi:MAG: amidohydrolase [Dehalococcoidia bacterium]|nr:amidohydrolase [Dehalococcoidia bacterium]